MFLFHVQAARVVLGRASLIASRRRRLALTRELSSWNLDRVSRRPSSRFTEVSGPHLPSAGVTRCAYASWLGRLVDDPVMMAASLRLGTTTVRDDLIPAGYRLDACFL